MKNEELKKASGYIKTHRLQRRWQKVVTCLAAVVVFCTVYALILPAITLEKEPVLACSYEVHQHDDSCYDADDNVICGYADYVVHTHDTGCYGADGSLVCPLDELEEHEHDSSCYEKQSVLVCGQIENNGHRHDASCYSSVRGDLICTDGSEAHEHTDACYNRTKERTCGLGEGDGAHRHSEDCYESQTVLTCEKPEVILHTHSEDCYEDILDETGKVIGRKRICDQLEVLEHVHDESCFVSADSGDEGDNREAPDAAAQSPAVQTAAVAGEKEFIYENDQFVISLNLKGTVNLPVEKAADEKFQIPAEAAVSAENQQTADLPDAQTEGAGAVNDVQIQENGMEPEAILNELGEDPLILDSSEAEQNESDPSVPAELSWDDISMETAQLDANDESYKRLADFAQEQNESDELLGLLALRFQFLYEGMTLDVSDCTLTASITSKETAAATYSAASVFQEEIAPEAETGVVFSVLQEDEREITELDNVLVTADDESALMTTVSLKANGVLALAAAETANPKFTVQYYAYVDQVDTTGNNPLTLIDTSGGILPQNGTQPTTKNLYLTGNDNTGYTVATNKNAVVPVYSEKGYEYIQAPNLTYFNRLYENGNYQLKAVWILKEGKSSGSTNESDWDVYSNPANLHFTNRAESAADGTILIKEGAVIRLVFNTTSSDYTNAATFYDYDITDGKFYRSASTTGGTYATQAAANGATVYAYTDQQGINSAGNYTGSGAKLAFGNANTGMNLDTVTWGNNTPNIYNRQGNGYQGCTFGLVTGLDTNGNIQYASGLVAPKLFNEGAATGKTVFQDQSLIFNRDGDTYTLSAVSGSAANISNLNQFTHVTSYGSGQSCNIFTNFFWPMDTASTFGAPGHDLKFGQYGIRMQRQHFGDGTTSSFPTVDENRVQDRDHNSYFGMQYAVQFTLTEDYIGPLEYYFFGDDDMWVFLDGRLVCDIGGVHSSVGEYVNLWDYLRKGDKGTHTLSFFYTERGASGSSCYMRFTLPSVSSVTPEQNTGTLRVEKEVIGPNKTDKTFNFQIRFTDADGNNLKDDYSYTRYDRDGNVIKTDVIIYDGGTFQLKDGEYIIVKYLPVGAKYSVTETDPDPDVYQTTVSINGGTSESGRTAQGTIELLKEDVVHYVNQTSYELPQTGGAGTLLYTFSGIAILASALMYDLYRRRRGGM